MLISKHNNRYAEIFESSKNDEISIYIHWPFCLSKCPYCDFNSHVDNNYSNQDWIQPYLQELNFFAPLIKQKTIKSIFFGGGTPSLMPPILVEKIINKISSQAILHTNIEISLEANPNSSESQKFLDFKKTGINRISIGVQSLNDKILKYLGRQHTAKEAIDAIHNAQKHFDNVSIDIIYACVDHNMQNWSVELKEILSLETNHLSLYQLTIEKDTKFYTMVNAGKMSVIDSTLAYDLNKYTNQVMQNKGYLQYEISNYAKDEKYICKHNLNYWLYNSYLGIGPGAHSRVISNNKSISFKNYNSPTKWKNNAKTNSTIEIYQHLTTLEYLTEALFMGLRLCTGINTQIISSIDSNAWEKIKRSKKFFYMAQENLIIHEKNILKLTKKGLLLHTEIVKELIYLAQ